MPAAAEDRTESVGQQDAQAKRRETLCVTMSYAFLFKYIIIGDTGESISRPPMFSLSRARQRAPFNVSEVDHVLKVLDLAKK